MEIIGGEEEEFGFSRNFFVAIDLASSGKKSTHKLSDIDLVDEQLRASASSVESSTRRRLYLWCGFGLLMYGFGSKKALLEDFASTALSENSAVVINGYLKSIDIKQVKENDCFVCVVIHNIDGPGLGDSETQQFLARVASCSHVRMIASIDHQRPKCQNSCNSITNFDTNAQRVFEILSEHQLSHPDKEGMRVDNLYATSRELFLASSQVTLNSHLTELKDHELVKTRFCLYIPLASEVLEKLLSEMNQ